MISIIACIAKENRAIGYQNQLLYHIKEDMARFKKLTTGHTIIMGRKTYESLPHGALSNRRNVVISRSIQHIEGCEVYPSLEKALKQEDTLIQEKILKHNKALTPNYNAEEVFIIGGESIYRQALPFVDKLYLTVVEGRGKDEISLEVGNIAEESTPKADVFFPDFDKSDWKLIEKEMRNENGISFSFLTYLNKRV